MGPRIVFAQALAFAAIFLLVLLWLPETGSRANGGQINREN